MKKALLIMISIFFSLQIAQGQDLRPKTQANPDFGPKAYSNPGFMLNTNLGKLIQTFYKLGNYDNMVKFTASETLKKYGTEKVREYYENCDFGYYIEIISMKNEGKYKILTYNAKINATNKVIRIKSVVENDTAKIVLDNLNIITK